MHNMLIVGAGPSGLATAIAAGTAGLDYEVLEKGVLVNSIFKFPRNMVFFTTPELLEIGGLPFVTPYEKPTQWEALRYYRRVTDSFDLRICLGEELLGLERLGGRSVSRSTSRTADGERAREARNVVLATGYYDHPNRLGVPGEDLPHVYHYYDEPHPYYRKRVVVVGGKNSAAIAALELHRAGASVTLVHRRADLAPSIKYWIRPDIENRVQEGSIAARFETRVVAIRAASVDVEGPRGAEDDSRRCRLPDDRLHPGRRAVETRGRGRRSVDVAPRARSGDVGDQRERALHRRGPGTGARDESHLHRERSLPRRGDRQDDPEELAPNQMPSDESGIDPPLPPPLTPQVGFGPPSLYAKAEGAANISGVVGHERRGATITNVGDLRVGSTADLAEQSFISSSSTSDRLRASPSRSRSACFSTGSSSRYCASALTRSSSAIAEGTGRSPAGGEQRLEPARVTRTAPRSSGRLHDASTRARR